MTESIPRVVREKNSQGSGKQEKKAGAAEDAAIAKEKKTGAAIRIAMDLDWNWIRPSPGAAAWHRIRRATGGGIHLCGGLGGS
jgi:hypothetical protein